MIKESPELEKQIKVDTKWVEDKNVLLCLKLKSKEYGQIVSDEQIIAIAKSIFWMYRKT